MVAEGTPPSGRGPDGGWRKEAEAVAIWMGWTESQIGDPDRLDHAECLAEVDRIAAELVALAGEWDDLRIENGRIVVATTDLIELEGITLGRFELRFDASDSMDDGGAFEVVALRPNPAAVNSDVTHPHVSSGRLCSGDVSGALHLATSDLRLADAFDLVNTVLHTYNSGSAFARLDQWEGEQCPGCNCTFDPEVNSSYCDSCEQSFCESCTESCSHEGCSRYVCGGCSHRCSGCHREGFCDNCVGDCEACGSFSCTGCRQLCSRCNRNACDNCRDDCACCGDSCRERCLEDSQISDERFCARCHRTCCGCDRPGSSDDIDAAGLCEDCSEAAEEELDAAGVLSAATAWCSVTGVATATVYPVPVAASPPAESLDPGAADVVDWEHRMETEGG